MYHTGEIAALEPRRVFDVSEIREAFRHFASSNRIGKVAISLEDPNSMFTVNPSKFQTTLCSEKTYLLVGCLGGLGRALAKYDDARYQKFVCLGRSGLDRPVARQLVEDLESQDAIVTVVRGDVSILSDVQRAVDAFTGSVDGVIQAAMGLDEMLFTNMAHKSWHKTLAPRICGSWNLQKVNCDRQKKDLVLGNADLDFFLLTSSISGTVGTATESNYCAANYFLDAFAHYRQNLGLSALSVGLGMISEVGYLHENSEIEALLLRKGIQAITKDEMLQIVDLALSGSPMMGFGNKDETEWAVDPLASSHMLTGLEPLSLRALRKKGFEGTNPTLDDPRAAILAGALDGNATSMGSTKTNAAISMDLEAALQKSSSGSNASGNGLSKEDKRKLTSVRVREAVLDLMVKRFSNLTLISAAKLDVATPLLAKYGMDSMLAAEFRTWIWKTCRTDVPLLELLNENISIAGLVEVVVRELETHL